MEAIQDLRKFLLNCNIAGFTYDEGCIVMEELNVGSLIWAMMIILKLASVK